MQGIGLIGARHVPHYWLQLISVTLSIVVGLLLLNQPGGGLLLFTVLLLTLSSRPDVKSKAAPAQAAPRSAPSQPGMAAALETDGAPVADSRR